MLAHARAGRHQQTRPTQLGRRSAQSDSQRPRRRAAEFAQNEQRFDAGGVAAPSVEAATRSRSRLWPLVAALGQRQPRPRGDGRRVYAAEITRPPPDAARQRAVLERPTAYAESPRPLRREGPTDRSAACPLVTGMSYEGSSTSPRPLDRSNRRRRPAADDECCWANAGAANGRPIVSWAPADSAVSKR